MSKSYKLKRGYDILKVLSAMGIGGLTINGFSNLVSTHHTAQDIVITIVGILCTLYFAASYMKINMEKDNLMEKLITTVENNKKWGKINKATAEANAIKIGKLEKSNPKSNRGKR